MGIAHLLLDIMDSQGIDRDQAIRQFWGLSSRGLLIEGGKLRAVTEYMDTQLATAVLGPP